jgi:hypothetical protein
MTTVHHSRDPVNRCGWSDGYNQRAVYSPDTWTWEIRPIVDKTLGRWYLAFNPALERTLHGPDVNQGLGFSPDVKVSYDFTPKINGGI